MKQLFIITLSLMLVGCFPAKFIKTPSIEGKVIDKETKEPVSNAKIYFKKFEENRVTSDQQGVFKLSKNEEWGTFILLGPFHPVPPHGVLVVGADGYEAIEYQVGFDDDFDGKAELKKKE